MPPPRSSWILNLVHFADPIHTPDRIIDWVATRRRQQIATIAVDGVQLAQWRFSGRGMVPRSVAAVSLRP
ncbi:hypothetical protein M1L60_21700 [Actinoplanes sp. TRM 88003]|uniref:Uncharacterized protein n=1 Tax=Paractinoplanes aksuensis TaxID=2939490 RepID=A0ABT1DQX2_9ACTN|nr:hypothetical protein [Actinoplanes aksuensis]MCO8273210.1 hypothetical protein [Actinoplanes aksuensis]